MQLFPPLRKPSESAWDVQLETVTPERAKHLLTEANFGNRNLRPHTVSRYTAAIRAGEWRTTPETLSMSPEGRLLNGQHRLHAVVQSGTPCTFLFVYGVDEDVYEVLDRGAGRSVADALRADKKLVEAGSLLARLHNEGPALDSDIRRATQKLEPHHEKLMGFGPAAAATFSSAPFRLAAVARLMQGRDPDYVGGLYRDLVTGDTENLSRAGHAVMRRFLAGNLPSTGGLTKQCERLCVAWPLFDPQKADTKLLRGVSYASMRTEVLRATGYSDET